MEIQGQQLNVQNRSNDRHLQLREGEVYKAKVESRISDREVILSIRGQEVKAKFDGKVPDRERIQIEVQERKGDGIRVREVKGDNQQSQQRGSETTGRNSHSAERVLRELGHREPSRELIQHSQRMIDRGVPLTRETANDLNRYIESGRGTERQRAQTVQMMAQKRLEPSSVQLRAVHEALHGRGTSDQIKEITNLSRSASVSNNNHHSRQDVRSEIIRAIDQVRHSLQSGQNVRRSIEQLQQVAQRSGDETLRQQVNQALREMIQTQASHGRVAAAEKLMHMTQQFHQQSNSTIKSSFVSTNDTNVAQRGQQASGLSATVLSNWSNMVQNEPNLSSSIDTIRTELSQLNLKNGVIQQLNERIEESLNRLDTGRELKARQVLLNAFSQLEQVVSRDQLATPLLESRSEMQQYVRNEVIQTSGMSAKNVLITEVTERLAQATDQFKSFQRETSKQLTRIDTMIQQFRNQAVQQTKPMLENVIKQMDRIIMKSNWMLFADMKTERKMLGASSQLAEAKKLLDNGKYQEARQIVREVQQTIDRIQFKPSNQRVQHFLSQEQEWRQPKPQVHRLSHQFDHTARSMVNHEGSPRQVFEGIRGMGLTRESELAQMIASGKDLSQQEQQQRNIKSILMNLARGGDDEGNRQQQQAQQALQNLTGQQLLSRTEPQQNQQMMQFQIPVMLKGETENLQVYLSSRNEGQQIDWENCNLYFYIDTKKLGPLGIALNVVERSLSVTLKNDTPQFSNKIEPLTEKYLDNLNEVGFNIRGIQIAPMTPSEKPIANENPDSKAVESIVPIMTDEGFDYKI
ncbi:hypothetical protein CR194_02315 [Salipaludibacillus keqinensis]|uniref:Flagellar hook-length control protein-like C-terminal domain-containing protein n=1 Tax=Salipaludibacillus keqinensis TaxID=2045207 RepID=A0A323TKZ5_9BACI|nr:hypothetical protein [Salipaludibacillus keqinensis]PYZ94387.1 hypothetical protein CR194_02315 [Salipaludibacillus keqinensis]